MSYKLVKLNNKYKKVYNIICKNLPNSIFNKLGFNFFKKLALEKIIHIYCVKKNSKLSAIITVMDYENYKTIDKQVLKYLIIKPFKLINIFLDLKKSISKTSKFRVKKNYLHLLHLIIFKNHFLNISLEKKNRMFDNFYKKILKYHKSKILFLCFEEDNKKAKNYYLRNKFKFFYKIGNIIYFKKIFKI